MHALTVFRLGETPCAENKGLRENSKNTHCTKCLPSKFPARTFFSHTGQTPQEGEPAITGHVVKQESEEVASSNSRDRPDGAGGHQSGGQNETKSTGRNENRGDGNE